MPILEIEKKDNVAVVTIQDPDSKVNKLHEELMDEFMSFLDDLEEDKDLRGAILISGKESNFIAGADLEMVQSKETQEELEKLSREGNEVMLEIEKFPKPIVVCIHGSCMGGGAELALACHYRILSDHRDTRIALPEVKLGLIPGMGGTQRLPRLIGIQKALTYMLTGKSMYSRQALKNGFADEVTDRNKLESAGIEAVQRYANRKVERKDRRGLFEKLLESTSPGRLILFSQAHKKTAAETRGNYPAPPQIIESVRYGYREGYLHGLKNESRLFGKVASDTVSKALIQLFFTMNEARKNPESDQAREVQSIGVLGAGLMGSGIAEVSMDGGYQVWLKDQTIDQASEGEKSIYQNLDQKVKKRILSEFERDTMLSQIHPTDSYENFKNLDLVIEAVFEDLELKKNIVQETEQNTGEQCIFASNTSSLPITKIAESAGRPENIIGMHYFSPVQKMPLLEIIKTESTARWVIATAREVGVKQGKSVIVVNDGPGFYTTRILSPYMNEALILLEEGGDIRDIDRAMKDFGFPVGPLTLLDEVGIDVGAHVAGVLEETFSGRGARTSTKARELVDAGFKGRKNGMGFYTYDGKKKKRPNRDVYRFFGGSDRKRIETEEIQFRLVMMMVNEAVHCLHENILTNPQDGDLGAILGLGFPPFLGGPFRYIDREGAHEVTELLKDLEETHGIRFRPAPLLSEKANSEGLFYS